MQAEWLKYLILLIAGFVFGIASICMIILVLYQKPLKIANTLFIGGLLCLSITMLFNAFVYTPFLLIHYPHILRLAFPLHYAAAPLLFFYIQAKLNPDFKWKWIYWVHFMPVLLHFVELIPFYLQPASYKVELIKTFSKDITRYSQQAEGWLPPFWHPIIKCSLGFLYQVFCFYSLMKKKVYFMTLSKENKLTWKWLVVLVIQLSLLYGCTLGVFLGPKNTVWFTRVANFGIVAFLISSCTTLLMNPEILLEKIIDVKTKVADQIAVVTETVIPDNKPKIVIAEVQLLKVELNNLFAKEMPFLQSSYNLSALARDIGTSTHKLSYLLNKEMGFSFNDFVNKARIDYLVDHISEPEWKLLTLEAMGEKVGFSSRSTFIKAFKQHRGVTPSAFIHDQNIDG